METAKSSKFSLLIATLTVFLAGCVVMYFIRSHGMDSSAAQSQTKVSVQGAQNPKISTERKRHSANDHISKQTAEAHLRGAGARWVLNEIKRDKSAPASVNARFFATINGKLSQQFIDFFEISPAEAGDLFDLIQATRTEMWRTANSQAQVSQTETGGVIAKIPPVEAGADIYDKVMSGFQTTLGDERHRDMMFFSSKQLEKLFNEFGAEERIVSIEKSDDDRYKITDFIAGRPGEVSSTYSYRGDLEQIRKRNPELAEFVPAPASEGDASR